MHLAKIRNHLRMVFPRWRRLAILLQRFLAPQSFHLGHSLSSLIFLLSAADGVELAQIWYVGVSAQVLHQLCGWGMDAASFSCPKSH